MLLHITDDPFDFLDLYGRLYSDNHPVAGADNFTFTVINSFPEIRPFNNQSADAVSDTFQSYCEKCR